MHDIKVSGDWRFIRENVPRSGPRNWERCLGDPLGLNTLLRVVVPATIISAADRQSPHYIIPIARAFGINEEDQLIAEEDQPYGEYDYRHPGDELLKDDPSDIFSAITTKAGSQIVAVVFVLPRSLQGQGDAIDSGTLYY